MTIGLKHIERFCDVMAHCLRAGTEMPRAVELAGGRSDSPVLRRITAQAVEGIRGGDTMAEALEAGRHDFPRFVLPVVRAGEESGRLEEAFAYLRDFCHKLIPTRRIVRNAWMYPLVVFLFGWVVRFVLYLWFAPWEVTRFFILNTLPYYAITIGVIYAVAHLPQTRHVLDLIKLQIPFWREEQVDLAVAVYFETLSLAYEAAGMDVARMGELAAEPVENVCLRRDLLRVAESLAARNTFADSLAGVSFLSRAYLAEVAAGETAGRLEKHLRKIAEAAAEALTFRLEVFNGIVGRLMGYVVVGLIAMTALQLFGYVR